MSNSIASKALSIAHQIRNQFQTWSEAVTAAWKIAKLFLGRSVNLTFAKSTGEVREAKAVAVGGLNTLSKGFFRFVEMLADGTTQWRSCRLERMIF